MKLTDAQRNALEALRDVDGKSGGFYIGLGIHPNTLIALEDRGLADGSGHWKIRMQQWRITGDGIAALESQL